MVGLAAEDRSAKITEPRPTTNYVALCGKIHPVMVGDPEILRAPF